MPTQVTGSSAAGLQTLTDVSGRSSAGDRVQSGDEDVRGVGNHPRDRDRPRECARRHPDDVGDEGLGGATGGVPVEGRCGGSCRPTGMGRMDGSEALREAVPGGTIGRKGEGGELVPDAIQQGGNGFHPELAFPLLPPATLAREHDAFALPQVQLPTTARRP